MNILAIDLGSYSVKFVEVRLERSRIILKNSHEVIISKIKNQYADDVSLEEVHCEIIASYLEGIPYDGKVLYQFPNNMITSRVLDLPVNSRKKAEMMIPFQLDENLPFSMAHSHFTSLLEKNGRHMKAYVYITHLDHFDEFFGLIQKRHVTPSLLTSELSIVQRFVAEANLVAPYCVVDIGHETTKAYFVKNRDIVSHHVSHIGGLDITKAISENYNISFDEAEIYKHQNSFFLTDAQIPKVEADQKEFALLMKATIEPLVSDLKRWEIGFRVKNGVPIDALYLTGGGSQIKNFANFLAGEVNTPCQLYDLYRFTPKNDLGLPESRKRTFFLGQLMTLNQTSKIPMANFLRGQYAVGSGHYLPLHSVAFTMTRTLLLGFILLSALFVERMILETENQKMTTKITTLMKNPALKIKRSDQRKFRTNPQSTLQTLKKQNRLIKQDVSTLLSSARLDAITPLGNLSKIVTKNNKVSLTFFKNMSGDIQAQLEAEEPNELELLKAHLDKSGLNISKIDLAKGSRKMRLEWSD